MNHDPTPRWQVIHGDCLEVLKTLPDDVAAAIVSDPPYGVAERTLRLTAGRSNAAESIDHAPIYGDSQPFDPSPWLGYQRVILFGANHYANRLPNASCWLVWDKREAGTPDDNADCEMAWTNLGGPARLFHHLWRGMIKASERDQVRLHPTQKPVELMCWCIQRLRLAPNSLVVDPYCGSGTTGVAAIREGMRFLGIEREAQYVEIARRRIADAAAQTSLFDSAASP